MDGGRPSTSRKVLVGGGVFLAIDLLLVPWYQGGSFLDGGPGIGAFGAGFYAWGGSFLGMGAAAVAYLQGTGWGRTAAWPVKPQYLSLALAAAGFALVLIRLITRSDEVFVGLVLALVVTASMTLAAYSVSGLPLPEAESTERIADP